MPQTGAGKKAQLCVLFGKEESAIVRVPCWKPASHISLTTGPPVLCSFLQGIYIGLFDNISVSNKQKEGTSTPFLFLPFPTYTQSLVCICEIPTTPPLHPHCLTSILAWCLLIKEMLRLTGTLCRSSSPPPAFLQSSHLCYAKAERRQGAFICAFFKGLKSLSLLLIFPYIVLFYFFHWQRKVPVQPYERQENKSLQKMPRNTK